MPNSASQCSHIKGASEAAALNGLWFRISIYLAVVSTGLHFMPLIPHIGDGGLSLDKKFSGYRCGKTPHIG